MSKTPTPSAGLLDLASLDPGPVHATLYETIRRIAGVLRAPPAGETRALQEQGPVGLLDDERTWHVGTEPEAVILVAGAKGMERILDGAFRDKLSSPARHVRQG